MPYFGHADDFPLQWHKIVSESPSGSSCVNTIQDFLEGYGFSDPELEKLIVNSKGETLWQLHQKTCKSFGEFEGFYWLFRFDALGKVTDWDLLPFENCRLGKPDDKGYISKIFYNPFFGTPEYRGLDKKQTVVYDCYNPQAVRVQFQEQGEKFKGQVLFVGTTTAASRFYPYPKGTSCSAWMKIEKGVSDYHQDNINNGFLQAFMLIMKGQPNEPSTNPDYTGTTRNGHATTVAEEFDDVVSENFMGAQRNGNMFVHWVSNAEEKPEVLPMPSNNNGDLFVTIDNQAQKKITTAFNVVPILANISEGVSLGGDGNMIRVAVKMQQQRAKKGQRVLADSYSKVLKNFTKPYVQEITIAPYNPYPELEVLDDKVWAEMSKEERRTWIEENTEVELIDAPPVADSPQAPQQARLLNVVPTSFPPKVVATVKKAIDYQEKMGLKCGGLKGREVSKAIMENQNLGLRQLTRIYSFLKKNSKFENSAYNEGCPVIEYNAWGGKEMELFLEKELERVNAWLN